VEGLKVTGSEYEFIRHARGRWEGTTWKVEVEFSSTISGGAIARLALLYGNHCDAIPQAPRVEGPASVIEVKPQPDLEWPGIQMRIANWSRRGELLCGEVSSCLVADLWSTTYVPRAFMPHAAVENIIRAAAAHNGLGCRQIRVGRLRLIGTPAAPQLTIMGREDTGAWWAGDRHKRPVVELDDLVCSRETL